VVAAAATATNNLRANVEPDNTIRSEITDNKSNNMVPANAQHVSPTEAEGKVATEIKDVGSKNHTNQEEVVATKTPPLDTSASTGDTAAAGSAIKDFERQKGVVIGEYSGEMRRIEKRDSTNIVGISYSLILEQLRRSMGHPMLSS
jgi:hypothetical protein